MIQGANTASPSAGASASASAGTQRDAQSRSGHDQPPERVVRCYLVEDNALLRRDLTATLEDMLPLRMVGSSGDERSATRWIAQTQLDCDVMIIDLVLKVGSGLEVLRKARKAAAGAKLVVLSNYATPDIRQRCEQVGADRVFDKSTELEALLAYCEELARPLLQ